MSVKRTRHRLRCLGVVLGGLALAGCSGIKDEFFVTRADPGPVLRQRDAGGASAGPIERASVGPRESR